MNKVLQKFKEARNSISPCRPYLWARTGHLQTILGHLLKSPSLTELGEEVLIPLQEEKGCLHSTYLKGDSETVVYLFHGLAGNANAAYMQRAAIVARKLGHHVYLNNHRGCGAGLGLSSEPYHSGRAEDLAQVVKYGRSHFPQHKHVVVGFSLSANASLLLAAGVRSSVFPDAVIAVNPPVDLARTSMNLNRPHNLPYNLRFTFELKRYVANHDPSQFYLVENVFGLEEFDEKYTALRGGFKNRIDYYRICSSKQYLNQLQVPTVIISALDDPILGSEDFAEFQRSPKLLTHIENFGGHMGYLGTKGNCYYRWLDKALLQYLRVI